MGSPGRAKAAPAKLKYAFVCTWLSLDRFKREYPTSAMAGDDALRALVREVPDWVRLEGGEKNAVLIPSISGWRIATASMWRWPTGACCSPTSSPTPVSVR